MEMTKSKKVLGTIELIAAAAVLVIAVVFAPAYGAEAEPQTQALTETVGETQTEPPETTTEPTTAPPEVGEYTVSPNYIVLTKDAAMEMYSVNKQKLLDYGAMVNALAAAVPEVQVYALLAPTRMEFYGPEEYRTGSHSQKRGIEIAYGAMGDNIVKVDAYDKLSRHTDEYIYFRTDHHWTARGAYQAYTAFCEAANLECKPLDAHETARLDDFVGSMYRYTQSEALKNNPDFVEVFYPTVEASGQYFSTPAMDDGKNLRIISTNITDSASKYMAFIQGDKALIKMTTNVGNGQKILLIKESYGNAFAPFLLENYSEVYVLDPRQEGVQGMNLPQFLRDNGIQNVLLLNYMMAPSNSKFTDPLRAMIGA
ncbi:MAG: DHHW family protein [Candidatus Fimenecus sp.]